MSEQRKVIVEKVCVCCGKPQQIELTQDQYERYIDWVMRHRTEDHIHIQDALPDVPAEIRELFISGVCNDCFIQMFALDEEEE